MMNKVFHASSSALLIAACLGLSACQESAVLGEDLGAGLSGVCATGQLTPFATGQNTPQSVVLSGQQVFWFNGGVGSEDPTFHTQVMKVSESGGTPVAVATSNPLPASVDPQSDLSPPVFGGQSFYWIRSNYDALSGTLVSESVVSMPQSGGAATVLATWTTNHGVLAAADADSLYFVVYDAATAHSSVLSMPKTGGATTVLVSLSTTSAGPSRSIGGLLVDADRLYWTFDGDVMSVAKSGGSPVVLAPHANLVTAMVQDADHLYWTGNGEIRALAKSGGAPVTLGAAITEPDEVGVMQTQPIFTDGACLYSTSPTDHALMAVPKSGGTFAAVAAIPDALTSPSNWVADQTGVYVAEADDDGNGFVLKLAR